MKKQKVPIRIKRLFPNVTVARDATETIDITVAEIDAKLGRRKEPGACALAKACLRKGIADGAAIGIASSWLIKGNVATRYKTSVAVSREITSFDRHQDFAAGQNYKLSKVAPSCTSKGQAKYYKQRAEKRSGPNLPHTIHKTANIRVLS